MNIAERVQEQYPGAVMLLGYSSGDIIYRFKKNRYWLVPDKNVSTHYSVKEWDFDENKLRSDGHPQFSSSNPAGSHYNLYFKPMEGVATKKVQARVLKLIQQYNMPMNPFANREELRIPPRPKTPMLPAVREAFHLDEIEEEEEDRIEKLDDKMNLLEEKFDDKIDEVKNDLQEINEQLTQKIADEHNYFMKTLANQDLQIQELTKKIETLKEEQDLQNKKLELQCELIFQGSLKLKEKLAKQKNIFERLRAVFLDTIDDN
jgi:hypothetical protein